MARDIGMQKYKAALLNLVAVIFLVTNAAFAASFDCAKAQTKIEKMICTDPELSKLDEELGAIYLNVIKDITIASKVKKDQKGWLKWERNRCSDVTCLKEEYQQQITELRDVLAVNFPISQSHYPPYPNVWQQMFPDPKGEPWTIFFSFKLHGGDYVTFFTQSSSSKGKTYLGKSFFDGAEFGENEMHAAYYKLKNISTFETSTELKNYIGISLKGLDGRMSQWCPQGLNHYYEIIYPDGHKERKSLLYFLDQPVHTPINDNCAFVSVEELETSFVEKVGSLVGNLVPLDDGGFLLADKEHGVVIRFDSNFHTQSDWFNKHVIVVDTDELVKMGATQFETMNYQHMQDVVYEFLMELKQSGRE